MSDQFKQRISKALEANKLAKLEKEKEKTAQEEARKRDFREFKSIVDSTINPAFEEFSSILADENCQPEIKLDLREQGLPQANYNSISITFTAPNDVGRFGGGRYAKVEFQRDPGGRVTLKRQIHQNSMTDNTGTRRVDRDEISREFILEVLTSVFEKIAM